MWETSQNRLTRGQEQGGENLKKSFQQRTGTFGGNLLKSLQKMTGACGGNLMNLFNRGQKYVGLWEAQWRGGQSYMDIQRLHIKTNFKVGTDKKVFEYNKPRH